MIPLQFQSLSIDSDVAKFDCLERGGRVIIGTKFELVEVYVVHGKLERIYLTVVKESELDHS